MLTHLRITDFALLDDVEIEFGPGFNVLTGETGAGKSLLVEAVALLARRPRLGGRGALGRRGGARRGDLRAAARAGGVGAGGAAGAAPASIRSTRGWWCGA